MNGPYHDLVALIQFGNEAYVVTPFTTDYENILLSVRLVSDPKEWGRFSDWGTTIIEGIDQGLQLFKSFDFVNASGNLMIVFTDGRDSELNRAEPAARVAGGRSAPLSDSGLHDSHRLSTCRSGEVQQDKIWQPVIERTGGRFYAAPDEDSILQGARRNRSAVARQDRGPAIQRAAPALRRLRADRRLRCGSSPR